MTITEAGSGLCFHFRGQGEGGYSHNFIWPIRGCAAVQGIGFYLSVRNRYLIISLESMYFMGSCLYPNIG